MAGTTRASRYDTESVHGTLNVPMGTHDVVVHAKLFGVSASHRPKGAHEGDEYGALLQQNWVANTGNGAHSCVVAFGPSVWSHAHETPVSAKLWCLTLPLSSGPFGLKIPHVRSRLSQKAPERYTSGLCLHRGLLSWGARCGGQCILEHGK